MRVIACVVLSLLSAAGSAFAGSRSSDRSCGGLRQTGRASGNQSQREKAVTRWQAATRLARLPQRSGRRATAAARYCLAMIAKIRQFLADQSAATAIEHGLIAAGISVAIISVMKGLGTKLNTTFSSISELRLAPVALRTPAALGLPLEVGFKLADAFQSSTKPRPWPSHDGAFFSLGRRPGMCR